MATDELSNLTIDFADRTLFADGPPQETLRRIRDEAPVYWSDAPADWTEERGYWNVTRAADIAQVLRDTETYSTWKRGFIMHIEDVAPLEVMRTMMVCKDPPEHTRMRAIVSSAFTPRRVAELESAIRAHLTRLIDDVIEEGRCDFIEAIAAPYTNGVVAEMIGVPEANRAQLFQWTDSIIAADDPEVSAQGTGLQAMQEAAAYMYELVAEREAEPKDDLVTAVGRAEYQGRKMPAEEQAGLFIQLFSAGIDTTRGTLGLGLHALIDHPDQRALLLADPSLIPGAVEEILRWTSVVMHERRTATRDTVLAGQHIAKDDGVVLWLTAAGRDPNLVDDPDTFDVQRSPCRHQAFGAGGPHFCLGAGLARLELRVAFEELLRRMPDVEMDGVPVRILTNLIQGYKRMPIRFTAGSREQQDAREPSAGV